VIQAGAQLSLVVCLGDSICALPIGCVAEVLRPLPILPLADPADAVLGVSIVRGATVPIVDGPKLLGAANSCDDRLVVLRVDTRRVGLMVTSVLGVRAIPPDVSAGLPPLLAGMRGIAGIAALDGRLMAVLDLARLVPPTVFSALDERSAA